MPITLRPYQAELKPKIFAAWQAGYKNVLLVMPTGMGKTKLFCSVAIDIAIDPNGPRYPTAISVHRKELVQQISLTLAEEGIFHNIIAPRPVILGIIAAHRQLFHKSFYDSNGRVTAVSVDTLNARIGRHQNWAKSIRFWIKDEAAHVLKNNKWGKAVSYFPNAFGLGVTATPQRLDKRGLGSHADGVFDIMIQGPTSRWGIEHGFLCNYKIAVPPSDYRDHLKAATEGSDFSAEARSIASAKSHIVGNVVRDYIKFAFEKQAILFADSIEAGAKMERKFRDTNIKAKLLTGDTDDKERLQALIDFREKKIQVLLNVDLFDEGLDVPGIECVIMARPTMSLGKYLQMIGRGLRPAKNKEFLIIIDHVGNVREHGLPDAGRYWTLDRIVKRRDKVNLIRICMNYECNSPFDRILTECPYCGLEVSKGSSSGTGGGKPSLAEVDGDLYLMDAETLRQMEAYVQLESPADIAKRVSKAAGGPAGIAAMRAQQERIEMQKELVDAIATWAGKMRMNNYTDRQIHKAFYLHYGMTITQAISQTRAEMLNTKEEVENYR